MDIDFAAALQDSVSSFALPEYNEIPDVGLFLDQVVRYTAKYTDAAALTPLTGSMISNYVKKKVIPNPIKKLYDRDQIACLLFIAFTKSVIQIEDMAFLFRIQQDINSTEDAYGYFRQQMLSSIGQVFGLPAQQPEQPDFDHHNMLKNICIASSHEIYLDHCMALLKASKSDAQEE